MRIPDPSGRIALTSTCASPSFLRREWACIFWANAAVFQPLADCSLSLTSLPGEVARRSQWPARAAACGLNRRLRLFRNSFPACSCHNCTYQENNNEESMVRYRARSDSRPGCHARVPLASPTSARLVRRERSPRACDDLVGSAMHHLVLRPTSGARRGTISPCALHEGKLTRAALREPSVATGPMAVKASHGLRLAMGQPTAREFTPGVHGKVLRPRLIVSFS